LSIYDLVYWLFRSESFERCWFVVRWSGAGLCRLLLWSVSFHNV